MDDLFNVKYTKMLSFSLVAEALKGLIYHRPSGENFKFKLSLPDDGRSISRNVAEKHYDSRHDKLRNKIFLGIHRTFIAHFSSILSDI